MRATEVNKYKAQAKNINLFAYLSSQSQVGPCCFAVPFIQNNNKKDEEISRRATSFFSRCEKEWKRKDIHWWKIIYFDKIGWPDGCCYAPFFFIRSISFI